MQTVIVAIIVTAAVFFAIRHCVGIIKNKRISCDECPNCDNKSEKKQCCDKK
ncbi:MAG: FeoB-associated Cys-rich membrane protein [Prevotella sp.]|nr:FeoB-associated Cys-rich membrane protein [Prevotella sp.]